MRDISCATVDAASDDRSERRTWTRADTIAITVVTAFAAVVRAIGLGSPGEIVFDERFYARDACWYVRPLAEVCGVGRERSLEHPPLGKWLIAAGDAAVGHSPVGWRLAAVIAGVLTVALTFVLARKLLGSTFAATFAASLLATDFLHFVQSRIAMLDVFVALFTLAAVTCLVWDRDDLRRGRRGLKARPWRVAAGAAAGAAVATKWAGVFALLAVVTVAIAWELWTRRPMKRRRALLDLSASDGFALFVSFFLVPAVIYVAAHVGRVDGDLFALPWAEGPWLPAFWDRQQDALRGHLANSLPNPYQSPPWSWLLLKRAFPYHFEVGDDGLYRQVTAMGNPLVWWVSIPVLVYVTATWLKNNSPERPEGVVLAGFYWSYLPWIAFAGAPFLFGSARTALFIFYVTPLLPFMFIAMASVAQKLVRHTPGRVVVALFAAGTIALTVFYYPFLVGAPLPREEWRQRIWVFNDCERPGPRVIVDEIVRTNGVITTVRTEQGRHQLPPMGWCWVQVGQGITRTYPSSTLTGSP